MNFREYLFSNYTPHELSNFDETLKYAEIDDSRLDTFDIYGRYRADIDKVFANKELNNFLSSKTEYMLVNNEELEAVKISDVADNLTAYPDLLHAVIVEVAEHLTKLI